LELFDISRGVRDIGVQSGFNLGQVNHGKGDMNPDNAFGSGYLPKGCQEGRRGRLGGECV
jgi:hypothetical protein